MAANPDKAGVGGSGSRERDLILGAIAQVDRSSTGSSAGSGASGAMSDPDAPTSVSPSVSPSGEAKQSHPEAPTSAHDPSSAAMSADEMPADAFPGYEILREIHRGGQGVVYQAMQLTTKRKVAIKVMHGGATLGSTGRARFEREVQVLGQLNHPNIVKLHDSGVTKDGSFFYVMDYISGKPLDEVIREQRRAAKRLEKTTQTTRVRSRGDSGPDIRSTLELFAKVCEAVNAAHLRGVIHRDIKPANVRIDSNGEPIVVDFGLAKAAVGVESDIDDSGPMTVTGQFIGSLPWASPEQAEGSSALDVRTDVYSLGVVLFQMLTGGKFPYKVVGTMREVLDNIVGVEPARPSTVRKRIGDEVETIVLKALAKERDRRYQSAGELARDIHRYLDGEAIEAKRDSAMYVLRKTVKRHKVPAAFAATVAVLTVAFGIGMTGAWSKAAAARDEAEENWQVAVDEKDRAEQNLKAIREMARTFIFDFNGAIEHLRGATAARELVLKKALEYLDAVQTQAIQDPAYLLELAAAHDQVGDLLGELYGASTGTTDESATHYAEALRIREQVRTALGETDAVLAGLRDSEVRAAGVAQKRGQFQEAIQRWQNAVGLAQRVKDPLIELDGVTRVGDLDQRLAISAKGADAKLALLDAAAQQYDQAKTGWSAQAKNADADQVLVKRMSAELDAKRAQLESFRARVLASTDTAAASDAARSAVSLLDGSLAQIRALRGDSPADYVLGRSEFLMLHHLGEALSTAADVSEAAGEPAANQQELLERALASYESAEKIARSLAMDESNLEAQRDLGIALNKIGNVKRDMGDLGAAQKIYDELIERREEIVRTDSTQRHRRDLAVAVFKQGEVSEKLADAAPTDGEAVAYLRQALAGYRTSRDKFRELGGEGVPVEGELGELDAAVDRVEGRLKQTQTQTQP